MVFIKKGVVIDIGNIGQIDYHHVYEPCVLNINGEFWMWHNVCTFDDVGRIALSTSRDGVNWERKGIVRPLGSKGDSDDSYIYTCCVLCVNDKFWMWYSGYNKHCNCYHIFLATSNDGVNWEKKGIVLIAGKRGLMKNSLELKVCRWLHRQGFELGGFDIDNHLVYAPSILCVNGEFWMWYSTYDENCVHIAFAASKDGVNWKKKGIVLDIGITGEIYDHTCCVLCINNEFWMWYGAISGEKYNTSLAISKDGVNWIKMGIVLDTGGPGQIDESRAYKAKLLYINGEFRMWYAAVDSKGTNRVALAISKNGL